MLTFNTCVLPNTRISCSSCSVPTVLGLLLLVSSKLLPLTSETPVVLPVLSCSMAEAGSERVGEDVLEIMERIEGTEYRDRGSKKA